MSATHLGRNNAEPLPLYVPVALREDQALAALAAVRAVFMSGVLSPDDPREKAPLAQAMVVLAQAIDKARDRAAASPTDTTEENTTDG